MKQTYVKPEIFVEEFLPKQRIAACSTSMSAVWSNIKFQCENYTLDGDGSCNDNSQHNADLDNLKKAIEAKHNNPFTTTNACSSVCATVEEFETWIMDGLGSTTSWKIADINTPGGKKVTAVTRNAHQHVLDIKGYNMYEDTFASL